MGLWRKVKRNILQGLIILLILFVLFLIFQQELNKKEKLILISIDAAEWRLINELIDDGKLPHFKSFIEKGSHGGLYSPYSYSPISWTEILTGKTKEKHGVSDFLVPDRSRWTNRYDIKSKRIWDYLNDYNISVGIYRHYFTWPVGEVNGFIISGFNNQSDNIYPKTLEEIKKQKDFSDRFIKDISKECKLILKLFNDFKPEFYTFFDNKIHITTHSYWKSFNPQGFNLTDEKRITDDYKKIIEVYSEWDNCLGLIEDFTKDYDIIVVSDHGMADQIPIEYHVSFGKLFQDLKIEDSFFLFQELGIKESISKFFKSNNYIFMKPENGKYVLYFYTINQSEDMGVVKEVFNTISYSGGTSFFENVTTNSNSMTVFVDENNFKQNFILDSNKDDTLLSYRIPITIKTTNITSFIYVWEKSGEHPPGTDGILMAKGPSISQNFKIKNASVYDITPTILYLYGIPVPENMDGRVLKEMIQPKTRLRVFLKRVLNSFKNNSQIIEKYDSVSNVSEIEDEEFVDILRKLGYMA